MEAICSVHPSAPATGSCVGCSRGVCDACAETVAGHVMCRACIEAATAAAPHGTAPPTAAAPGAFSLPEGSSPVAVAEAVPEAPSGPANYLRAIGLGTLAAIACAIVWDKFVYYTHIQIGLVAVFLGVAVGIVVKTAAGGRGPALPWIGAVLAGFSILLGYVLLGHDSIMADPSASTKLADIPFLVRVPLLALVVIPTLDLMDWVFVAIGVYEGWSIPRRP